jgi:hypothetical protein
VNSTFDPIMTSDTPTIFFSYGRADAEFVLKLANDLRSEGISLWIDQLDIPAGERWDIAVGNALKASPSLLLVLSPASVASQNVMDEVAFALESNKKIVPVLHRRCDIPFRIRRLQYIDFTATYDGGFTQLLRTLKAPQVVAGGNAAPDVTRIERRISPRRFIYLSAVLLLVVMVGVGLVYWIDGDSPRQEGQTRFCDSYAKAAVADEKFNKVKGCDFEWKEWPQQAHYDWCMSQSREQAQKQWDNRKKMVEDCRQRKGA